MRSLVNTLVLVPILLGTGAAQNTEWADKLHRAQQAQDSGHYTEAVAAYREAAALADGFTARDARAWATYNSLAVAYAQAGFPADSMRAYHHAMALVQAAIGKENGDYVRLLVNLGTLHMGQKDTTTAESMLREALGIERRLPDPDPPHIALTQSRLGEVLLDRRRYDQAEQLLQQALPVLEEAGDTLEAAMAINNLGLVRQSQRRYAESLELIRKGVARVENKLGPSHPLLLRQVTNLAVAYYLAGDTEEAGTTFRRAEAICDADLPPDHPSRAMVLAYYAEFLRRTGDKKEAKTMRAQAQTLERDIARRNGSSMTVDVSGFRQR